MNSNKRLIVECFSDLRPIWHGARQKCLEVLPMAGIAQVRQLVRNHIIEADGRLLGELEVQPDFPGRRVARAPAGLHVLDLPRRWMQPRPCLPEGEPRGNSLRQRFPVEVVQKRFPLRCVILRVDR